MKCREGGGACALVSAQLRLPACVRAFGCQRPDRPPETRLRATKLLPPPVTPVSCAPPPAPAYRFLIRPIAFPIVFLVCLCCCFDSYLEPRASPSVSSPPHRMTLGESGQNLGDSQVSQLIVRFYIRSHPIFLTSLKAAARSEIFLKECHLGGGGTIEML